MTKCTNCGAVMPAGAPGMTLRCEFCGVQTRIPQAPIPMVPFGGGQPPIYPVPQGYMPGAPVKMSPVYYIVPFAFTLGIAGFGIFMSAHAQREAQERAIQAQQQAMAQANQAANEAQGAANAAATAAGSLPSARVYRVDELGTPFDGWQSLNAPGMVGTLDEYDAIANIPWAADVGRHWVSDARITRIDFDRVNKDGMVAMRGIPDAKVTFRYESPSRAKEWLDSSALTEPNLETELMVTITKDGIKALKSKSKPMDEKVDPAIVPPKCTLSQVFASLDKKKQLPDRPVYNVYMIDNGGKSAAYYISTLTGSPQVPWVDSTSCK